MKLNQANILTVDDDKDVLTAVRLLLKNSVRQITTESRPENLMRLLTLIMRHPVSKSGNY